MSRAKTRCAVALFLVVLAVWPARAAVPAGGSRGAAEPVSVGIQGVLSELWSLLARSSLLLPKPVDPSGTPGASSQDSQPESQAGGEGSHLVPGDRR